MNLSNDLQLAVTAAKRAGDILRQGFSETFTARVKSDRSLVTDFDGAAEAAIREVLAVSPYSIMGEEAGLLDLGSSRVWIIDPLDGTTNFTRRLPHFVVSIGLMEGDESLIGVVYDPLRNACYYAEKDQGAFKNGARLCIDTPSLQSVIFLECGVAEQNKRLLAEQTRRLIFDHELRLLGASALGLAQLADGAADAFVSSGDQLWDFAAGLCLVQEAGGVVCDWRGRPWRADHSYILAGRKETVDALVGRIGDLQPV